MTTNKSDRIDWIDALRGIGMCLIVLGHMIDRQSRLGVIIYNFHVPLFFCISGYLYNANKKRSFADFALTKIDTLLIPYFIWGAIMMAAFDWLDIVHFSRYITLQGIGPTWFLVCLLFSDLICSTAVQWVSRNVSRYLLCLSIFAIAASFFGVAESEDFLSAYQIIFHACTFWMIGFGSRQWGWLEKLKLANISIKLAICFCCASGAVLSTLRSFYPWQGLSFALPVSCLIVMSWVVVLMFVAKSLAGFRALTFIGVNSLIIMCLHEPISPILQDIGIPAGWGRRMLGMTLLFVLTILISKYMPILSGKLRCARLCIKK